MAKRELFRSSDIWPTVIRASLDALPQSDLFRLSMREIVESYLFHLPNIERFKDDFHSNYFDEACIVTDLLSLEKLSRIPYSASRNSYEGGFIYCYTEPDRVLAGKKIEGWMFFQYTRYDAVIKCGQSERHPLRRITEQYQPDSSARVTNTPEPPVVLSILWTQSALAAERAIHMALDECRLRDKNGNEFRRAGAEWFLDRPESMMKIIHNVVVEDRERQRIVSEPPATADYGLT